MKRTGGATAATLVGWQMSSLSSRGETVDHPTGISAGDSTVQWFLRCKADPSTILAETTHVQEGWGFLSKKDTGFDPPGPGDATNCKLECCLYGSGPKVGDEASSMSVIGSLLAEVIIRNVPRVYVGPGPASEYLANLNDWCLIEDQISRITITATIDTHGVVTWTPSTKVLESEDGGLCHLGYSRAKVINAGTFVVSGESSHSFVSVYSGTVSAAVRAQFFTVFEAELSTSVTADINNLGIIDCKPDSLHWGIVKVRRVFDSAGTLISEEEFSL